VRNDATIAEMLSGSDLPNVFEVVASTTGDFGHLVTLLRLDRSQDFVFSNMREVDFSNTDLRGFNFTGADLRDSYGTDVIFDDTTILEGADVQGSCFATYKRERQLFLSKRDAGAMYEALRIGDPYEVSSWIHSRFTDGLDRHPILRKADDETAAILCQKLLTDEIELTKRADLFYHLRGITRSPNSLRELLLNVLARHARNIPVMQKFITIAGGMYSGDQLVGQALLTLTKAQNEQVRETAFVTLSRTRFFGLNFAQLRTSFMNDANREIRQRLLMTSAISLDRRSLSVINLNALLSDVPLADILDYSELLDEGLAAQIATITRQRAHENERRSKGEKFSDTSKMGAISVPDVTMVVRRQEEVLCSTPVIKLFFAADQPERSQKALARLRSKSADHKRKIEGRIARGMARR
tara:strand:- start:3530 stop:4765 length:1236 start_codon:yes stop_codon:yes gene_type:complete